MNRVIAVVEGYAEQVFVRDVLAPWLGALGIGMSARLVGKPGHKGGVVEYTRAQRDILALLKQESSTFITTMFDFYGMPSSWPGRRKAGKTPFARKASTVEQAIFENIAATLGSKFDKKRFVPYIQMHEFEALLFSHPKIIAEVVTDTSIAEDLQKIRSAFETPEEIDDSPKKAPSKRIEKLCPSFQKPLHGVIAAQRIGIAAIRQECPHFNEWISLLEQLAEVIH